MLVCRGRELLAGSGARTRGMNDGGGVHGSVAGVRDSRCSGAICLELAAVVGEGFMDVGRGSPLDGTRAAFAVELDVESIGDGGEAGGGTLLIWGGGPPGLAGALCADADLTVDRLADGWSDGRGDLPFAGLKLEIWGLGLGSGKRGTEEG